MNSKKIVSSLVFAVVFSAAIISNASAAAESRYSLKQKAAGGVGIFAALYGGYRWLNRNDAQEVETGVNCKVSCARTDGAPFIIDIRMINDLQYYAMIPSTSQGDGRNFLIKQLFNKLLVSLGGTADVEDELEQFVTEYAKEIGRDHPVQVLVVNQVTGDLFFAAAHNSCLLGLRLDLTPTQLETPSGRRSIVNRAGSVEDIVDDKLVLCCPNTSALVDRSIVNEADLLDSGSADMLIGHVDRLDEAVSYDGFAAIVIDFPAEETV